jgi:hypothetical protein
MDPDPDRLQNDADPQQWFNQPDFIPWFSAFFELFFCST